MESRINQTKNSGFFRNLNQSVALFFCVAFLAGVYQSCAQNSKAKKEATPDCKITVIKKTDEEWKKQLSSIEFAVARKAGTERAFSGEYWDNHEKGIYKCICCDFELFTSDTKFESGTGWPSFWKPINDCAVENKVDVSHGMVRTEVLCNRCKAHLGHVFEDGPKPTGLRYCMNSVSLKFVKK
ncbi:peptide-methionine (R)-S-oxide reductase MsrB [Emticicia sp. 17c]|uniref:peptide-methionine (R)-S-oxide reductase MsrB n=1 Tax=Emticicia sp. 17c TaxID=3127704 RepID=UPI00301D8720